MATPSPDLKATQAALTDMELIERLLQEWLDYGYKDTGMTVFDRKHGHFLLLELAWQNQQRIYQVIAHIDLIDNKFWIQLDHTPTGLGTDLEQAGIPKSRIVLGFYPLEHRQYGEYAVQ
jgi:hypothetical protein